MTTCMPPRHPAKQRGPGGMASVLPVGADWVERLRYGQQTWGARRGIRYTVKTAPLIVERLGPGDALT